MKNEDIETVREFVQTGTMRETEWFRHGADLAMCRIVCGPVMGARTACKETPPHVLALEALDRISSRLTADQEVAE